jgi:asparagine synthase (glutamine-hydrolysing)
MCGISGFWAQPRVERNVLVKHISSMNDALEHRGPDDAGIWVDEQEGVGLANRRLAILDLSANGHQPILSDSGRFVIAYNGEIYNFGEIRQALQREGKAFRGDTDTEIIVEGSAAWGLAKTLRSLNGMFAFALWDRRAHALSLVRDRIGIKPLYYGRFGTTLLFGSELKALVVHPAFRREIDRNSLALFLRHGYIPSPYTIYKGVRRLPAGHTVTLSSVDDTLQTVPYWSAKAIQAFENDVPSDEEATAQLEALLRDAVRLQMVSDVPLGAFLSGGVDSSTVVALMQAQSARPVRTFSIGFGERDYNEANYAAAVAEHLGTDHVNLYVSPGQVAEAVEKLPDIYDEPFADSSQIPTYLLSRLARGHVTVALSGDGGDELFGGYDHYKQLDRRWRLLSRVPHPFRSLGAKAVSSLLVSRDTYHHAGSYKGWASVRNVPGILESNSPESLSHHCLSYWRSPSDVVIDSCEPQTIFTDENQWAKTSDPLHRMMYLDLVTYLPDDVLTKLDRATMAVSLEARVPLLDHRVVEFAMQLPPRLNFRNQQRKWLLRQVLQRYLPSKLYDRPKKGFSVPIGTWLKGILRGWAEELLEGNLSACTDLLDADSIRQKWAEHINGDHDWGHQLWSVLMFLSWHQRWIYQSAPVNSSHSLSIVQ